MTKRHKCTMLFPFLSRCPIVFCDSSTDVIYVHFETVFSTIHSYWYVVIGVMFLYICPVCIVLTKAKLAVYAYNGFAKPDANH